METGVLDYGGIKCDIAYNRGDRGPVILLHGYSFTWRVWKDIGLLQELERRRYSFAAPDMPYGRYSSCTTKTRDIGKSLGIVRELAARWSGDPVLLGASLGGYVALRYAASYSVRGLVLVAPVGTRDPGVEPLYSGEPPPTMIVYGTADSIVGLGDVRELESRIRGSRLVIYEGAGHAPYLDRPEPFVRDVLGFLDSLEA
ncbi:MAG: alpha/beta hydrolase [Desulfurococcales archaeon]|nr:alpha/beta hydrolase [Desulfurococcales archaeon]